MLKKFGSWIVDAGEIREVVLLSDDDSPFFARVHFKGYTGSWAELTKETYDLLLAWIEEQNTPHSYLVSQDGRMTWEWVKHNG